MARNSAWRRVCPPPVLEAQSEALNGPPLFMLRQKGPAAFIIKDERKNKPLHVHLSDPHSCNCREFMNTKELCVHVCWTLLKKLKLRPDDPLSFQLGLTDQEIFDILQQKHTAIPYKESRKRKKDLGTSSNEALSKPITPSSVCPICLEELLSLRLPVSRCRFGCGNAVHIKCMKVVAEHQLGHLRFARRQGEEILRCPLCRGDFGTLAGLHEEERNATSCKVVYRKKCPVLPPMTEKHRGVKCTGCRRSPVLGNLYRCTKCPFVVLCAACVLKDAFLLLHGEHGVAIKKHPRDRWHNLPVSTLLDIKDLFSPQTSLHGPASPLDYETCDVKRKNTLSEELVQQLPVCKVREGHKLLARGHQCCLCLNPYKVNQRVRSLPCGHNFHVSCSSKWLLKVSGTCPIDGTPLEPSLLYKTILHQHRFTPTLAQDTKRRPFSSVRIGSICNNDLLSGLAPPEVKVRQIPLMDRRDQEHAPPHAYRYLCRVAGDGVGAECARRPLSNRANSLPARPMRCSTASISPIMSMIAAQQHKAAAGKEVKGPKGRQSGRNSSARSSGRSSPMSMSVTSLQLPDEIGYGDLRGVYQSPSTSVSYCWGGNTESRGVKAPPKAKPPSARRPMNPLSPRRNNFLTPLEHQNYSRFPQNNVDMTPLTVTCTPLKLLARNATSTCNTSGAK